MTIMFSDLSGYTPMNERLDPEEVKEIMGLIFGEIREIMERYDGFIEKYIGDAVMAVFGIPKAHEDDPLRAIRAALEIHSSVGNISPRIEEKIGQRLFMHTGINTGLVVTGEVDIKKGNQELTGDAINLASRLVGLAEGGEIVVGQSTYQLTRRHFLFEPMAPTKLKGKSKPVPVFKLVSKRASDSQVRANRRVSSVMIGRDQEMGRLESQVQKAISGQGSVVNLIGEAGIGKSRLIAELKQRDVIQEVTLLEGRAISIGRNLSFHPIIDLIKQWARISEDDTEVQALEKLEKAVRTIHPEEADEILPFIATLMGMKLKGRHDRRVSGIHGEALEKLIFKNFRELMIKWAELRPTVIIMEDLHWADDSSLELLESLQRITKNRQLLFINVFRPGYLEKFGARAAAGAQVKIELQPLETTDGEALINNMLQIRGLPYTVKAQILGQADGNPFFIEEVVRSLIDEGMVIQKESGFQVTDRIEQAVIPPTINDVLMARIDRLEGRTRKLVKVASVIGRSFFDLIIKDVANSIDNVDDRLAYLKDVQIIKDRTRMQQLEYMFKHALAREAAYESILLQQRKTLHLKVARSIEKIFKDRLHEFYGMLAFHYGKAEDLDKAGEYLTRAGEEALKASASSEALNYLQEALKLYVERHGKDKDPETLAKFEKNIALAFLNKAQWTEAVDYLDKVLERWGTPIPKTGLGGIALGLWGFMLIVKATYVTEPRSTREPGNRVNQALDLYFKAVEALSYVDHTRQFLGGLDLFRRTTQFDISKISMVSMYWSGVAAILSVSGLSFRLGSRLLEMGQRYITQDDIVSRMNHVVMSTITFHCQGVWDRIQDFDDDLLNAGLRIGDLWQATNYLIFYGLVKGEQGKFGHLRKTIEWTQSIGETYAYNLATLETHELKSELLLKVGSAHEALEEAEKGILLSRKHNNELHELIFLGYKAEAQQLSGDAEGARATISQASELHDKQSVMVLPIFVAPFLAARLFVDIERLKQAIDAGASRDMATLRKQARNSGKTALKNASKYAPYRTKIFRLMGEYHWVIKKQGKAIKWWRKAIREGTRLGARPDLSLTYFKVGKRLLQPQTKHKEIGGINAKAYLDKARVLFEEIGLYNDLVELEKIVSRS
ncbi:MAG: adenylate/guanylate cyclase domain-containing protein [Deltaproteobacteria bacterium]|nr:adenylate/guanylate cyclase domain-containing protein [Deltaproteobacteria bacterium]